jgi:hypothetical protein
VYCGFGNPEKAEERTMFQHVRDELGERIKPACGDGRIKMALVTNGKKGGAPGLHIDF